MRKYFHDFTEPNWGSRELEPQSETQAYERGRIVGLFDDVVAENIFTTDMSALLENAAYRGSIYTNHFPTATWLEVKGLALPGLVIEIEMEAYKED